MQFFSLTDKGKHRTNNEDCCQAKAIGAYTVLALADGMGGANSGEVASSKAIEVIFDCLDKALSKKPPMPEIPRILSKAVAKANTVIYKLSLTTAENNGMGTTLEVCVVLENTVYIAHIGDSRVYKISRDGIITRLTKDHSLVEYMLDAGTLTPEEAKNHPQKNIITRALGTAPSVEADIISRTIGENDTLLVCSDGLSNMLSDDQIAQAASQSLPLCDRAHKLIDLANDAGGTDNITVVIAQNNS